MRIILIDWPVSKENMRKVGIILLTTMAFTLFLPDRSEAEQALNPQPATIDDLMRIKNILEVQISPDGTQVLYVISEADIENSKKIKERLINMESLLSTFDRIAQKFLDNEETSKSVLTFLENFMPK